MNFNSEGLALIKKWEACSLKSYRDVVGVLTIGWGHTGGDVREDMVITQEEADSMLTMDLQTRFIPRVKSLINVCLNDNQFSALICFAYNVGVESLRMSHLLKYVNENNMMLASNEFPKWDHAGNTVLPGLLNRRKAEQSLFNSGQESDEYPLS